jgi:hypothetical protein
LQIIYGAHGKPGQVINAVIVTGEKKKETKQNQQEGN